MNFRAVYLNVVLAVVINLFSGCKQVRSSTNSESKFLTGSKSYAYVRGNWKSSIKSSSLSHDDRIGSIVHQTRADYVRDFSEFFYEKSFRRVPVRELGCSYIGLSLIDGSTVTTLTPLGDGYTGDVLRVSDAFLIKRAKREEVLVHLYRDHAVLKLLNGTDIGPKIYEPRNEGGISANCLNQVLVMENLKGMNLWNLGRRRLLKPDNIMLLGIQMVRLIEELHLRGLVHGDIHPGNFVLMDSGVLRMIDFGFVAPFIDPDTEEHVPYERDDDPRTDFNPGVFSVYEMDGSKSSRRDDMARGMEILLFLFLGNRGPYTDREGVDFVSRAEAFEIKKGRQYPVPKPLRDAYELTRHRRFDEAPDYRAYIAALSQAQSGHT